MQTLHVVDEHVTDVGLGLGNRRRRPPLRPHTAVRTSEGPRTRPRPEQGCLRPGAASTHGNVGRPTHRDPADGPPAPCDDRGANASELVLQVPRVAVAALRGKFSPLEKAHEMAHFLRMAFIGASSGAAFFFMARRRFMPLRMPTKMQLINGQSPTARELNII